ncbi:MAG TPA: dethiobiotin synthase [Candidatus Paceibacterota bacterium]|nr:dethiobiotin synthase [Candidatus Paceibacterota bacterium]
MRSIFLITGTDTGVGKTVLASLLTKHLHEAGLPVAALKPLCSGDRSDAKSLRSAQKNQLTLDEVNPWHFRAPLSPLLAARKMRCKVTLAEVAAHIRAIQNRFPMIIVESAGGLLSPLGENFDSRDLIQELNAISIVVCPNRLGAINQVRLVLSALPKQLSARAQVVLMSTRHPDSSSRSNAKMLGEFMKPQRIQVFPWIGGQRNRSGRDTKTALEKLRTNLFLRH